MPKNNPRGGNEMNRGENDTEQSLKFDENGRFAKGTGVPAGFNKHPENRHNGSWHKEDTTRYWLESMMSCRRFMMMKRCRSLEGRWPSVSKMANGERLKR